MYLALYRKYRPRTFTEVISQPHITITLQNQIKSGQIAHAYLFTGSRGTGKTSCAKILAKAVNCIGNNSPLPTASSLHEGEREGAYAAPCLECESCKAADNSPDIQEIDAASNNGVDDIRALRDEAGYLPTELKYKVYIIDEVHMLSPSAFNALLKTLEEPPPHVIFILATTEVHKLPATIISRCQRYEFNRINSDESAAALIEVAKKEGITLEKDAALLISRLSDGGMRDALSLLDVAASENDVITQEIVRDCAGIAGKEHLFAIINAIAVGDGKTVLMITAELYAKSKDPTRLIDELLQHFRNLMIVKLMPGDFSLITALSEEIPEYQRQAGLFTLEAIIDCLDKLEDCLRLKGRRVEAEICLMRLACSFESGVCRVKSGVVGEVVGASSVHLQIPPPIEQQPPIEQPPPIEQQPPPQPEYVSEPPPILPPFPETPPPIDSKPLHSPLSTLHSFEEWETVRSQLDPFKAAMLEEASAGLSGNVLVITGDGNLEYFFDNPENPAAVEKAAREVTGLDYKVVFDKAFAGVSPLRDVVQSQDTVQSQQPTKIEQFLADVESHGIQLTIY